MEFNVLRGSGYLGTNEPGNNEKIGSLPPIEVQEQKAEQINTLSASEQSELENLEKADREILLPMDARERLMQLKNKSFKKG